MRNKRIYPLFSKKIENVKDSQNDFNVIISFEDSANRDKFITKHKDLRILKKFYLIPSIAVNLKKEQINEFDKEDLIQQIEEDQKLFLSMLEFSEFLELDSYKNSQISFTGKNVRVGIIDDGINKNFPSISNIISKQFLFSNRKKVDDLKNTKREITHGTVMVSLISNQFKNIDGNYIGIAPNVNYFDFNISNSSQEYKISDILNVYDKIVEGNINIDILLISFVTKDSSDGKDILSLACNLLVDRNIIIICPAGNFGPNYYTIGSPGAAEKVITVGALTKKLTVPNFSGRGPTLDDRIKPDLCFHGSNVIVPFSESLRVRVSGTSVSASICVGLIALIKEFDPEITYNDLIDLLKKTSRDLNYEPKAQGLGTVKFSDLFKELDLYHEKLFSYNYLTKRSLVLSIEFLIVLVILFNFFYFFNSWQI